MNAQATREKRMSEDSRTVRLETQMSHVESDVSEVKGNVTWLVRELGSFRTEMATRLGNVDTSIERVKTAMERNTRWLIGVGVGALASLLGFLGHALKWF